jgi:hypothetical protein
VGNDLPPPPPRPPPVGTERHFVPHLIMAVEARWEMIETFGLSRIQPVPNASCGEVHQKGLELIPWMGKSPLAGSGAPRAAPSSCRGFPRDTVSVMVLEAPRQHTWACHAIVEKTGLWCEACFSSHRRRWILPSMNRVCRTATSCTHGKEDAARQRSAARQRHVAQQSICRLPLNMVTFPSYP